MSFINLSVLNFTFPAIIGNTNVGNITIGVTNVNASHLDTGNNVDIQPEGNLTMGVQSSLLMLDMNVTFFINLTFDQNVLKASPLYEEGMLIINMTNNNMKMLFQLALKEDVLQSLSGTRYEGITDIFLIL